MVEVLFFVLGVVNNLYLIFIFLFRNKMNILKRVGRIYFILAIPAIYGIYLVQQEHKSVRYSIFLGIFLAFLALEFLYDYILQIPFRENLRKHWKPAVPYLALYYSMNYGFVVMIWKYYSHTLGIIMLGLFSIQIIINILTHPRKTKMKTNE